MTPSRALSLGETGRAQVHADHDAKRWHAAPQMRDDGSVLAHRGWHSGVAARTLFDHYRRMSIGSEMLAELVLPSTDSGEIRDAVVSDIMSRTRAQAGNWYSVCREPGAEVILLAEHRFQGPAAVAEALKATERQPMLPAYFGETAEEIELSAITHVNEFEIQTAADLPRAMVERFWDPGDIHCAIGFNAILDDRYAGWIGAFRTRPHPPFEPEHLALLKPHVGAYLRLLGAARIIDAARPGLGAVLVVRQGDRVAARSSGAAAWLESPDFEARIVAEATTLLDSGGGSSHFMVGHAGVRIFRLHGEGKPACAVLVTPYEETDVGRLVSLSQRRREVMTHAARNLTVSEIADHLGLSPETIKSHIKAIYDHFGIGSRAELSRIAAGAVDV